MEKDKALRHLRTMYKVPKEYVSKMAKNAVQIIERLISKNPDDRPSAEELLKSEFIDPSNSIANTSLAQYTYYLEYPDFKLPFDTYFKENEILNQVNKTCKRIFEQHGAKLMESAIFKPLTNSFTIFVQKFDYMSGGPKLGKKKSKKNKSQIQDIDDTEAEYIKIDYESCERVQHTQDQFSFKKQCLLDDKKRIEYLNANEVFQNTAKYLAHNLVENWARYLNMKNPGFIKRYCIDKVFDMPENKSFVGSHPLKRWEACFDICMSRDKGYLYNIDEDKGITQDEELMHEVEVLKVCYEVVYKPCKIILNSSVILDIIMEE